MIDELLAYETLLRERLESEGLSKEQVQRALGPVQCYRLALEENGREDTEENARSKDKS